MNRQDKIIRMLLAASGVVFSVSALTREWKLTLVAIVPPLIAMSYGIVGTTPDSSQQRLEDLLNKDHETRLQEGGHRDLTRLSGRRDPRHVRWARWDQDETAVRSGGAAHLEILSDISSPVTVLAANPHAT